MIIMSSIVALVLSLLVATVTATGKVTPAGKCNRSILKPVQLPYAELTKIHHWKVIYSTREFAPFMKIDHERRDVTRFSASVVQVDDTMVGLRGDEEESGKQSRLEDCRKPIYGLNTKEEEDHTEEKYTWTVSFENDAFIEESIDDDGVYQKFYNYPLGITSENAILYLRCSDTGHENVDTRYIKIPVNNTLSESGRQQLFAIDESYAFRGKLQALPDHIP